MNNNQLLAILLILFALMTLYVGIEKNEPTAAESGIKIILDLLKKISPIKGVIPDFNPPKRGTLLLFVGGILGIAGAGILISEALKERKSAKKKIDLYSYDD